MKKCIIILLLSVFVQAYSQQYSFQTCVDTAMKNNISLRQYQLNKDDAAISLQQARWSSLPDISASAGQNFSFGMSPTSNNTLVNDNSASTSFGVSASMPLFTGLKNYHNVKYQQLNLLASVQDLENAKEDIILSVAAQYLQVIYCKLIYQSALEQEDLSKSLLEKAKTMVAAGSLPESDLYDAISNYANDQLSTVQKKQEMDLALLDLAQLIDVSDVNHFDIVVPDFSQSYLDALQLKDDPANIPTMVANRPSIALQQLKIDQSIRNVKIAQSGYIPTINFNYSFGTSYYHRSTSAAANTAFFEQLKQNLSNTLSIGLSVPIFSRYDVIGNVKSAKINVLQQELQLEAERKTLEKEIQQAIFNARAAKQKYEASHNSYEAASLAYQYSQSKYEAGKGTIFELNDTKTTRNTSQSNMLQAKFEYIFRVKILDFYMGNPIVL